MTEIVPKGQVVEGQVVDSGKDPKVGDWVWVTEEDQKWDSEAEDYYPVEHRWFGCVMHIGSNYVFVRGPEGYSTRVHFDDFWQVCEIEPEPQEHIIEQREAAQREIKRLTSEVQRVTAQLAIAPTPSLVAAGAQQTQALAKYTGDYGDYKGALIKAKKESLPELFKELRTANESLANWMTANLLPLRAQEYDLKELTEAIDDRVFHVDLYAGLSEEVVQVKKGKPAPMDAKLHLFQRRHYMDEECLVNYEAGGMEFKDLKAFDRWLVKRENLERIMPFPRCIVSFKVRRFRKEDREFGSLWEFISFFAGGTEKLNEKTFLYLRNGDQVYRLTTGVKFGEHLFPDLDASKLDQGQQWAKVWRGGDPKHTKIDEIITGDMADAMREAHERKLVEHAKEVAERKRRREAGEKGVLSAGGPWDWKPRDPLGDFVQFNKESVYYDDIQQFVQDQITAHNRIALIVQGLLDRSQVFHPHPPWQTWTPEGFHAALELVYDDSRALTDGEMPDFEAYQRECNKTLKAGSVTVGQQVAWERLMAIKENEKDRSYRSLSYKRYKPYGDPGPGVLAKVVRVTKGVAVFKWTREAKRWPHKPTPASVKLPLTALFNVDAYKPGDYKRFFAHPASRAEYLKWAPFLLAAEDYHANKAKLGESDELDFCDTYERYD